MSQISNDKSKQAMISVYVGLGILLVWIIPFLGIPLGIVGLITGYSGLYSSRADLARAGIMLSYIGLFLSMVYLILIILILPYGVLETMPRVF